jgi:parallel beta-helix repeat protein/predicted outer membrane repeat protein
MSDRMWAVDTTLGDVRIENITIADSRATTSTGAALIKDGAGLLVLNSVVFSGNFGLSAAAAYFGSGPIQILNSTFSGNDSDQYGGAIASLGTAQLEITNSTVAGNRADDNGGGIHWGSSGTLTVRSSTIAGNTANSDDTGMHSGGGIYNAGAAATVQIANTLLASNVVRTAAPVQNQCAGAFTSSGYNLRSSDDAGCTGFTGSGDVVNTNPMIGTLGTNGGATNTVPLLTGGPAINAGNPAPVGGPFPACPATDQRGQPRGGAVGVCDIGSYELQPTPTPTPTPAQATTPTGTAFDLRAAIKKCKKKFPKGKKRKKCIKRTKRRAQA